MTSPNPTPAEVEAIAKGLFTADLISDFATRRCYTTSRTGRHEHAYYDTPENGIHLCAPDINDAAATAARYPMQPELARRLFGLAKAEAECGDDERDFVVDLFIAGEVINDFGSNRQLWPRAIAAWNAAIATQLGETK